MYPVNLDRMTREKAPSGQGKKMGSKFLYKKLPAFHKCNAEDNFRPHSFQTKVSVRA